MSGSPSQRAVRALRHVAALATWMSGTAITIVSVVPPGFRPVAASHNMEHVAVFVAFGALLGAANWRRHLVPSLWLVMFCAWVELIQLWVPGRHARFTDLLVDVIGGLSGLALVGLASLLSPRAERSADAAGSRASRPAETAASTGGPLRDAAEPST
jgi:VanZ family protein